MSKEIFESKRTAIEAIPDKEIMEPNMPIEVALQEAENLAVWCITDREALLKAGLDWKLVDDLTLRAAALRYIQSQWNSEYNSREAAQKEWAEKSPGAFDMRDVMVHEFLHAYHYVSDVLKHVQDISEGSGNADMVQDLSDLAALGRKYPDPLKKISFDLAQLDTAENMSAYLAKLLASANGEKLSDNKLCTLRNKAFTYLKLAVDEIRRNGKYAFWRNEARLKGYVSHYLKMANARAQKSEKSGESSETAKS